MIHPGIIIIGDNFFIKVDDQTYAVKKCNPMLCLIISRVVNIGNGIDTDSTAASDTQYRFSIGVTFKNEYRKGIETVSIDTPIPILHLC
jgi:hypothetical protein